MNARLLSWSLRHRRWRHVLNALIMAVTVGVVVVFVSVVIQLVGFANQASEKDFARILVWPKLMTPGGNDLPMAFKPMLAGIDGVRTAQCHKFLIGRHESGATYIISGEEDNGLDLNQDLLPVAPDAVAAWHAEKRIGAIVTETTAKELNLKVGQTATVTTPYGPLQIKVVGLSKGGFMPRRIAPHFDYLQEFTGNKGTCSYRVFTATADFERVAREIVEKTKNSPTPAQAVSDSQIALSWVKGVASVPTLLGFLGLFLALTTALTLANNAAISIRERRIEMATMRVIGFRRSTIMRVMLGESMVVGLIGGIIGIGITWFLFRNGVKLTAGGGNLLSDVTILPKAMIAGLLVSVLVPLMGALPAVISAVRQPLVEALRDSA